MAYTTEGNIEKYGQVDIGSTHASYVAEVISAVQRWIDNYVGYSFEITAATDKYYDSEGGDTILIDPVYGTPTIKILNEDGSVDETLVEGQGDDYLLYPLNDSVKTEIRLLNQAFPTGVRRVHVNGTHGQGATVPSDIQLVATKLAFAVLEKGIKGGKLSEVTLGDFTARFQEIDEVASPMGIYNILDQYRDIPL